jgi:SAM-dependent methyltransferase
VVVAVDHVASGNGHGSPPADSLWECASAISGRPRIATGRHSRRCRHGFDVVLLLGPLYHVHERSDRDRTLAEARRVVRPGGLIAVAAINRFASLFDGLDLIELVGVEGMAGWLMHLDRRWRDDADRETILHSVRLVESEPTLLGVSPHLLAVARRPA